MPTFEQTITIAAPVETVFAFDTDPRNWPRTMSSLKNLEIVSETDETTHMNATYSLLGYPMNGTMELTIVEPNEHMIATFESPGMTGETHNHYSETDAGTRIVNRVDYEFGDSLLERVIEPVAVRYNRRQFRSHLEHTKERIEAEVRAEATIQR